MKKLNGKAFMVITLFLASLVATPVMATGTNYDDGFDLDQIGDGADIIGGFQRGFGEIFKGLGYGGQLIGRIFEILLFEGIKNFSKSEMLDGVYVLNATLESEPIVGVPKDFNGPETETEYYLLPYQYISLFDPAFLTDNGYPYCEIEKEGTYTYNITVGAAVTLVIWDDDESFINALKQLIGLFNRIMPYLEDGGGMPPEDLIREGIRVITWFLIHINDIFTGDELFMLNPITWQTLELKPENDFTITKRWMVTGDDTIGNGDDVELSSIGGGDTLLNEMSLLANATHDYYMQWTFSKENIIPLIETRWTTFTFDLIQLWIKNFHIEIDVSALFGAFIGGGGGTPINVAEIFGGCDIEFMLFTHHLAGAFMYNDTDGNGAITANYTRLPSVRTPDGNPVDVPDNSELTHRVILNSVDDFEFINPHRVGNEIKWGLSITDVDITPVPIGVELDSYFTQPQENLDYVYFGFTFAPNADRDITASDGSKVDVLYGALKLDQYFAPWNNPTAPYVNNPVADLDLSIVYVSTVLHFHLNVATYGENVEEPEYQLDPSEDYKKTENKLYIGDYLDGKVGKQLDFVDIAGPYYENGTQSEHDAGTAVHYDASTAIIPVALWYHEVERHDTFKDPSGKTYTTFATDVSLNITFNVLVYAVCYPAFNGNGGGIWHDPTFSVYMIFESKGFWAIILLVAGVGLVGVATILIKRRKDARY